MRCGPLNQIMKPLSLGVSECDGLIAAAPWKNETHSPSSPFANWLPAEPDEPPFCLRIIRNRSFLEKMPYPCGGDAWRWHGMVEPLPNVECEPSHLYVIQKRPAQSFAEPFRCLALLVLVLAIVLRKALKLGSEDAQPIGSWIEPDWTMRGDGEAMPEGGLNQVCCEQLAHSFQ